MTLSNELLELVNLVKSLLVDFLARQQVEALFKSVDCVRLGDSVLSDVNLQLAFVLVLVDSGVQEHLHSVRLDQVTRFLYFSDETVHLRALHRCLSEIKTRLGQVNGTALFQYYWNKASWI